VTRKQRLAVLRWYSPDDRTTQPETAVQLDLAYAALRRTKAGSSAWLAPSTLATADTAIRTCDGVALLWAA